MDARACEQSIFLYAIGLESADERSAYLDDACRDQPTIRAEIEALLAAHERLGGGPPPGTSDMPDPVAEATLEVGSPAASERAGTQIGPYQPLEPIGGGGVG